MKMTLKIIGGLLLAILIIGHGMDFAKEATKSTEQKAAEAAALQAEEAAKAELRLRQALISKCVALIKSDLRDPDSYQTISSEVKEKKGEYRTDIKYRAKNGFGGYVSNSTYCSTNGK